MADKTPFAKQLLIAEDDDDDVFLLEESFQRYDPTLTFHRVKDGEELLSYLSSVPGRTLANTVVLLDLNMPRMNGKEALREIRSDARLKTLPVVVLSTSRSEEEVNDVYRLGVNSFVSKPMNDTEFMKTARAIHEYWFRTALLPEVRV